MKFHVSLTATEATTAEGQPLVRGGEIELTPDQRNNPYNARLIVENQLISVSQTDKAIEDAEQAVKYGDQPPPEDHDQTDPGAGS